MLKNRIRKTASRSIAFLLVLLMISVPVKRAGATAEFKDTKNHWGVDVIEKWSNGYGIVNGYGDGNFGPDDYITRGQFAAMLDRVMKYQTKAADAFDDLDESHLFYNELLKLNAAKVIKGTGTGAIEPDAYITREQAFAVVRRVFGISEDETGVDVFTDAAIVSEWAKPEVGGMAKAGYVSGYGGLLDPKGNMTRAQAVRLLENIIANIYSAEGTYTIETDRIAVVNTHGVVLTGSELGAVIVTQGVGADGDFTLRNSQTGRLVVAGGGEHSITIDNSSVTNLTVSVDSSTGDVRIHISGGSDVSAADVSVEGEETVYFTNDVGTVVGSITVRDNGSITVTGEVGAVNVAGDNVSVKVEEGANVGSLNVEGKSANLEVAGKVESLDVKGDSAAVNTAVTAEIKDVTIEASKTAITGDGKVENVVVTEKAGSDNVVTVPGATVENKSETPIAIDEKGTTVDGGQTEKVPETQKPQEPEPIPNPSLSVSAIDGTNVTAMPAPAEITNIKTTKKDDETYAESFAVSGNQIDALRNAGATALAYSQSNVSGSKVRLNVKLTAGDEAHAYLLATDGGHTYELLKTGFMGIWDGMAASEFNTVSSLTFFATQAGTYTLKFDLVNVSAVNSSMTAPETKTAGTVIATRTVTFTVSAAESKVVRGGVTKYYPSLATALVAANKTGDIVTLQDNANVSGTVAVAEGVTLNTNGHTLTLGDALTVTGTLTNNSAIDGSGRIVVNPEGTLNNTGMISCAIEWRTDSAWLLKSALESSRNGDTIVITGQIGEDVKDEAVLHDNINSDSQNDAGYYNFRVEKTISIAQDGDFNIYGNFTIGNSTGKVDGVVFEDLQIVLPRIRFEPKPNNHFMPFLYGIGGYTDRVTITSCDISTSDTVFTGTSLTGVYDYVYRGISLVPVAGTIEDITYNITGTVISFDMSGTVELPEPLVWGLSGIAVTSSKYQNEKNQWVYRYPGVLSAAPSSFGAQGAPAAQAIYDELCELEGNYTNGLPNEVQIAVWYGNGSGSDAVVTAPSNP